MRDFIMFVLGLCLGLVILCTVISTRPKPPPQITAWVDQDCKLDHIATNEAGDKVYRLTGKYTVVPSIIVVTRTGSVAIR